MRQWQDINKNFIWLIVIVLIISIVATSICIFERINAYIIDDSNAIPLSNEDSTSEDNTNTEYQKIRIPGFEVADDSIVWDAKTSIELFKVSYINEENVITVHSNDGDNIIAPGTEVSYTLKLKNTGDVAMDYILDVDASLNVEPNKMPKIDVKIQRYDGKWVAGNSDKYQDLLNAANIYDEATLGAGKYTYYTFNWKWPFENGNDDIDTMLGNMSAGEDVILTLKINTKATINEKEYADGGILPQTGDNNMLALWISLGLSSLFILICLLRFKEKDEEDNNINN